MSKHWLLLSFLIAIRAEASTFVGNGGNAGDLDLSVTLAEIHETFEDLDEESPTLCQCPDEYAENDLCRVLRALSPEQVAFCKEMMIKNKDVIASLSSKNAKVKFTWSNEPFTVRNEGGAERIVDAVTQNATSEIILNRPRFLDLPRSFRIALITHELFHLVPFGGSHISDDQTVGPFKDGKSFLDTLGAATALLANETGVISDFNHLAVVSRAHKKLILQLDFKSIAHSDRIAHKLLKEKISGGTSFTFEYKPEDFGYRLGIERIINSSGYTHPLYVDESMALCSLGIGHHWFPVTARLSRWSELHISLFVDGIYGKAFYHVSDEAMSLDDNAQVLGAQATGQIHVPIVYGYWGTLGYQARGIRHHYKDLDININELQQIFFLGGAYAL